jgi:hypothetical protein
LLGIRRPKSEEDPTLAEKERKLQDMGLEELERERRYCKG